MSSDKPIKDRETLRQVLRQARLHLSRADSELDHFYRADRQGGAFMENELRTCADTCKRAADGVAIMTLAELEQRT